MILKASGENKGRRNIRAGQERVEPSIFKRPHNLFVFPLEKPTNFIISRLLLESSNKFGFGS